MTIVTSSSDSSHTLWRWRGLGLTSNANTKDPDGSVHFFLLVKIQNRGPEQEIPAVTCVRLEGLRGFSTFFKQSAAIDIEMGINLRQAWGTIRREVGDLATGVFSVSVEDFPGPTKDGSCLSLGVPDVGVVPMKVQRAVTRECGDIRGALESEVSTKTARDPATMEYSPDALVPSNGGRSFARSTRYCRRRTRHALT